MSQRLAIDHPEGTLYVYEPVREVLGLSLRARARVVAALGHADFTLRLPDDRDVARVVEDGRPSA